jgi:acyl-CoA thioester hydrolase
MGRIQIEVPSNFLYEIKLDVRASDLNYGNHLGHDSVLTIMQEARIKFYRTLGFENELSFQGDVGQVISDVAVVYKSEAFLGDVLLCKIAAADFNKYGFDLIYLLINNQTQKEVARGKTGIVCFDYSSRKIVQVPAILLNQLRA